MNFKNAIAKVFIRSPKHVSTTRLVGNSTVSRREFFTSLPSVVGSATVTTLREINHPTGEQCVHSDTAQEQASNAYGLGMDTSSQSVSNNLDTETYAKRYVRKTVPRK